jgi:branched-chain amino acid transport system permease protein
MLLLASAQLFQIFLGGYQPLIGASQGIEVPDVFAWAETGIGVRDVVVLVLVAAFAALVYLYVERVARSPLGRTLRAVRDNEVAARALGKNDAAVRRNVIIVASAISAVAGALLTFYVGAVNAETWTRITWTFWIWVMVIIGGAANNAGVALGAFSFTFLFKVVNQVKFYFQGYIPFDVNWLEYLMFASLLIIILAFRPGGILPERSSATLPWRTIAQIVQSESRSTNVSSNSSNALEQEKIERTDKPG